MPQVIDSAASNGVPYRMANNGTRFNTQTDFCINEVEETFGVILQSGSVLLYQISCFPNTQNVGNYYSWWAANAGHQIINGLSPNSICPKNWKLSTNTTENMQSYPYLISIVYGITSSKAEPLHFAPLSLILAGSYDFSAFDARESGGYMKYQNGNSDGYTESHLDYSNKSYNLTGTSGSKYQNYGMSIRCVNR